MVITSEITGGVSGGKISGLIRKAISRVNS